MSRSLILAFCAIALPVLCGCEKSEIKTYPVRGIVQFSDGKLLRQGYIEFENAGVEERILARAEIQPDEEQLLRPGMFITARIVTASRDDALLVPRKAVFYDEEKPTFFLIDEAGAVRKTHFASRASTESLLEIAHADPPDAAVEEGALIVIVGQDNLKDGDIVRIDEEVPWASFGEGRSIPQ